MSGEATPTVGCILLTMGTRPVETQEAIASLLRQKNVDINVAVVGNGWQPVGFPADVKAVGLPENLGIPAGRNAGVPHVHGEYLFFLDDDAVLPTEHTLRDLIDEMAGTNIALVQPRVQDAEGKPAPDRWVPRIKAGDHSVPGPATTLWEGAVVTKRAVFDSFGGWGDPYFYAHEGIELCWRTWDTGHRVWYAGNISVHHPAINPLRHSDFWFKNARNRVWLAKRNLPWILVPIYPLTWVGITVLRLRSWSAARSWFGGFINGWLTNPGGRKAMKWSTVWQLTKAGRPPVI